MSKLSITETRKMMDSFKSFLTENHEWYSDLRSDCCDVPPTSDDQVSSEEISTCCGSPNTSDFDICPDCKEHTDFSHGGTCSKCGEDCNYI